MPKQPYGRHLAGFLPLFSLLLLSPSLAFSTARMVPEEAALRLGIRQAGACWLLGLLTTCRERARELAAA
jgi:hypothetical protein